MERLLHLAIFLFTINTISAAQADVINWTVDGQFADNTFISGHFSTDTVLRQYISFDVTTQRTENFVGHHYDLDDSFLFTRSGFVLRAPIVAPDASDDYLALRYFQDILLLGFDRIVIGDITEISTNPNDASMSRRRFSEPVIFASSHNPITDLPEPASIALVGVALIALASLCRRDSSR